MSDPKSDWRFRPGVITRETHPEAFEPCEGCGRQRVDCICNGCEFCGRWPCICNLEDEDES